MKKMKYAEAIIDGYNAITGAVVAVLSYILGDHWILFLAFLLLNVADWLDRMDEKPYGWKREQYSRMERRVEKAGVLAHGHGRIRSIGGIYRNRQDAEYQSRDHDTARLVRSGFAFNK